MPGPKATNRSNRPDTGSSDPKARKRLARRRTAWDQHKDYKPGEGLKLHRPGSENRKK